MQPTVLLITLNLLASPALTLRIPNEIIEGHLEGSLSGTNQMKTPSEHLQHGSVTPRTVYQGPLNGNSYRPNEIRHPDVAVNKRASCAYSSCDACYKEDNACKICNTELDNFGPCFVCLDTCRSACC